MIQLTAGNYGTLYIRQDDAVSEQVMSTFGGGGSGYTHGRKRTLKNVSIIGEAGVTIDKIVIEGGQFSAANQHSRTDTIPVLDSYIQIENLTIQDVTFKLNGAQAIHVLNNGRTDIKGLTVKNCVINGSGNTSDQAERIIYLASDPHVSTDMNGATVIDCSWSDIVIDGCEVTGTYQVIELRNVTNLTITNNIFKNVRGRDILIAGKAGGTSGIKGEINISNNKSDGSTERFLRASIVPGNVTLNNNVITNWAGTDAEFIKITDCTGTITASGNTYDGSVVEIVDGIGLKPTA